MLNNLNQNSNTFQAFWIAIGNLLALCVTIGSTMILTRYLDKFNYGTYKQVFFVYNTLLSVFTLGLPKAYGYFLPRMSMEEGKDFVNKITRLFLLLGGVFSLLLFFGSSFIANVLENMELKLALKIFSPVPIFLMPTLGLESIYATYKKTQTAAIYSIATRLLLFFCVTIPAVLFSSTYKEAVIGFVLSAFLNFLLALYLKNKPFSNYQKQKSSVSIKELLKFCLPLMGAGIFNILINTTDQFFISRFFGTEAFAEFSNGAMELPFVGMIVGACSTVLLPVYSKLSKNNTVTAEDRTSIISIWNNVLTKSVILIYPIIVFCMVYAEEIMVLLYGESYRVSGLYFFIMLFNNFLSIIGCYPLILALNKTKEYALAYLANFILLVILEFIIIKTVNKVEAICIVSVLCLWLRVFLFFRIITKTLKVKILSIMPVYTILKVILLSVVVSLAIHLFILIESNLLNVCVSAGVFSIFFLALSRPLGINYFSVIKPLISRK